MDGMRKIAVFLGLLLGAFPLFAEGKQIGGSGVPIQLPGRAGNEPKVLHRDVARAKPGDYLWKEINKAGLVIRERPYADPATGKQWGWVVINQGDVLYARKHAGQDDFMAGFNPLLPNIDESGEKFMEYKKTDDHSRKVFESGKIEDVLRDRSEFDETLAEFKQRYPVPIPRRNTKIKGATNWYYLDKAPADFPRTYWAMISLEGRIMKVIIANGSGHRLAVSYWATADFMQEYPNATWSWSGEDKKHSRGALKIQEDISETSGHIEFSDPEAD